MGIRLVGLKSTGMTSANAQNRGIGWGKNPVGRGQNSSCSLMNTKHTYTHTHICIPRTLRHVHQHIGVHIFTTQTQSELFKLVVNLAHKVAHSPHVISVWIKMDYWITRFAQAQRELGIRKYGYKRERRVFKDCFILEASTASPINH